MDVAPNGKVYVMDRLNHRIQRFQPNGTYITKVGARGTQPATFSWPEAVAVGHRTAPCGASTPAAAGSSSSTGDLSDTRSSPPVRQAARLSPWATLQLPRGRGRGRQRRGLGGRHPQPPDPDLRPGHRDMSVVGSGTKGTGAGQFTEPMGVAVTADAVYVADTGNDRIQKLSPHRRPPGHLHGL